MSQLLPLFPLQLVVFPGEELNLHIFEPRYKQLVKDCESQNINFGIPAFINKSVQENGTEVRLKSIEKVHPNGEMDVKTEGVGLFRIQQFFTKAPKKLYSGGSIEKLEFNTNYDTALNLEILTRLGELFRMIKVNKELPDDPSQLRTYDIAHHVGFSLEQEYDFLCILDEKQRQEFLLQHLERMLPIVKEMEALKEKVRMNGHFKNIIPPKL